MSENQSVLSTDDKVKELELERDAIREEQQKLANRVELFKAKQKQYFGLTDGEPIEVLEIVKAIRRIRND